MRTQMHWVLFVRMSRRIVSKIQPLVRIIGNMDIRSLTGERTFMNKIELLVRKIEYVMFHTLLCTVTWGFDRGVTNVLGMMGT